MSKFEITVLPQGVSVMKAKTLIDPETNEEVIAERHREAIGILRHVPHNADGDPDLSDPTAVEEAKAKAREEIKALIEDVAGPDFADLVGRIKVAEDERDLHQAEAEQLRNENANLKQRLERPVGNQ